MDHDINEYELIPKTIRPFTAAREAKEIHFERSIIVSEDDILLHRKLNKNQLIAYNLITERIFSNKAGAFFIDGPGGTGKTFLYRALLATIRSMGYIALATITFGVATSILSDGRTAHSHFKFPIDIDENTSCNISKESSLAGLIRDAKLIVWDEYHQKNCSVGLALHRGEKEAFCKVRHCNTSEGCSFCKRNVLIHEMDLPTAALRQGESSINDNNNVVPNSPCPNKSQSDMQFPIEAYY
uniref:ATP-dependent DNA helicase n=1 Tax=Nicotiana tabacum TaxID=4097 RepID=A0A1S3YIN8_TOBAC|nr:PREDICTED: uncharacterized protein LOC107776566 [Nicotiana tabacum]